MVGLLYCFSSFNNIVSAYTASNGIMIVSDKLREIWKELLVSCFKYGLKEPYKIRYAAEVDVHRAITEINVPVLDI